MLAWIRSHIKPLGLLVAMLYTALRPWLFDGQTWSTTSWLSFAMFATGAIVAFLQTNATAGVAQRAKEISIVLLATLAVLTQVLPDGLSRADVGTIIVAVAASLWSLIDGDTPVHALSGSGGAHVERDFRGGVA